VAGAKAGLDARTLRGDHERQDAIPFESERKYMATVHEVDGQQRLLVKGHRTGCWKCAIRSGPRMGTLSSTPSCGTSGFTPCPQRGLRVLALAEKDTDLEQGGLEDEHAEDGLVLLGLVGMFDPPREEVIEAVKQCLSAGIRPVMVTGDHAATALAIARQLGFAHTEHALTGKGHPRDE